MNTMTQREREDASSVHRLSPAERNTHVHFNQNP
jgi:hypothetical protein